MSLPIEQIMQMLLNRKRPGAGGDGDGNIEGYKPLNYNYNDLLPLIQGNIENNIPLGTLKILQNIRNEMLQMPEYNIPFEPFKIHKEVGLNINPYQPIQPIITGEEPTEEEKLKGKGGKIQLGQNYGGTLIHTHDVLKNKLENTESDIMKSKIHPLDKVLNLIIDQTGYSEYGPTGITRTWDDKGNLINNPSLDYKIDLSNSGYNGETPGIDESIIQQDKNLKEYEQRQAELERKRKIKKMIKSIKFGPLNYFNKL